MTTTCHSRRWLLAVAGAILLGGTSRALAQEPASETLPSPAPLVEQPPPYVLPDPGWPTVDYDTPDPLLDRPNAPHPGYYTNVEVNPILVEFRNQLNSPMPNPVTGHTDNVQFPGNKLNPTVSPRIELGYRFPDNWGSCQLGYTSIASQGSDLVFTGPQPQDSFTGDSFQGFASQTGRLDLNMFDLTYVSQEFIIGPKWSLRAGAGVRYLSSFLDSRIQFLAPAAGPGAILAQAESNRNSAGGVWAFLDVEHELFGIPGLCFFGRLEGTQMYSRIRQNYSELIVNAAGTGTQLIQVQNASGIGLPFARGVAGLSYTVPRWNYTRFMLGYQYGSFFQLGRLTSVNGVTDTRGQLNFQGLMLRAEFHF